MKLLETVLEIFGWIEIVVGVTLGAGLIAGIVYIKWNDESGKIVALIILSIGFLFGVVWATKIWRKHGAIEWLSRIRKTS